jgi:hypothetical protein
VTVDVTDAGRGGRGARARRPRRSARRRADGDANAPLGDRASADRPSPAEPWPRARAPVDTRQNGAIFDRQFSRASADAAQSFHRWPLSCAMINTCDVGASSTTSDVDSTARALKRFSELRFFSSADVSK